MVARRPAATPNRSEHRKRVVLPRPVTFAQLGGLLRGGSHTGHRIGAADWRVIRAGQTHASDQVLATVSPTGQACWEAWTASPGPRPDRRREIDTRLDAVRARLKKLREETGTLSRAGPPHPGTGWKRPSVTRPRRARCRCEKLASSAEAVRRAAEAHEPAASVHERAAASGIGDVRMPERQAALHRAAAADRQRSRTRAVASFRTWTGGACCCLQ